MLRVNVGLSRKLSHDFNSTGYSVNLEGELPVSLDDPEAVIERIREYYDLAEEVLDDQITKPKSSRPAVTNAVLEKNRGVQRPLNGKSRTESDTELNGRNGHGSHSDRNSQSQATNKQIQFLLALGKKQGLSKPKLESRIAEILGQSVGIYDLTKADAGHVLDQLIASNGTPAGNRQ